MNIKKGPLIAAISLGIPLHLLIFALASFQFFNIPFGRDQKLVEARLNARVTSGRIIAIGAPIVALAVGTLYPSLHARKFPLTMQAGVVGATVSNALAQIVVTVLFGCCPFSLSFGFVHYQTPEQEEIYRLLQLPFNPLFSEFGIILITIPLAALAGAICTTTITGRRARA